VSSPDWKFSGFVVDFATLTGLIVYTLAGSLILRIFSSTDREADV
jgi:leucyl aminopeptidase